MPINIHTKALIDFPLDNHESTAGQPLQVSLSLSLKGRERERESPFKARYIKAQALR